MDEFYWSCAFTGTNQRIVSLTWFKADSADWLIFSCNWYNIILSNRNLKISVGTQCIFHFQILVYLFAGFDMIEICSYDWRIVIKEHNLPNSDSEFAKLEYIFFSNWIFLNYSRNTCLGTVLTTTHNNFWMVYC